MDFYAKWLFYVETTKQKDTTPLQKPLLLMTSTMVSIDVK